MGVALQTLLVGLSQGSVFGLIAIGFTLVWSLTRTFALAHGDVVVAAVLVGVLVLVGRTPVASSPSVLLSVGLVVVCLAVGTALSVAVYLAAVRPFVTGGRDPSRRAEVLGWAAGAVTAGLAVRTLLGVALPASGYAVPDPLHLDQVGGVGTISLPGGATLPVRALGVLVVAVAAAVAVEVFARRSRLGRGMRAAADDREAAALCGVPIERAVLTAFAVAGLLAAVAGLLTAPGRTVTVDSGVDLGLAGAGAALLGRLGSPRGALVAGLAVGVLQQTVVALPGFGAQWSDVVPLAVLVVVVAARPQGFGAPARVAVE